MTQLTIAGKTFEVSSPYAAGVVELSEGEAHALNQTRHENIRNNFAKRVKEAKPDETDAVLQDLISKYDTEYAFGIRGTGAGVSRDPIQVEARSLARAAIRESLKKAGKSADAKAINAAVETLLASERGARFLDAARVRVADKQAIAEAETASMESIIAGIEAPAGSPPA